ncbi:MAG: phosphotransferase [Acidimicrobiales bacterium]
MSAGAPLPPPALPAATTATTGDTGDAGASDSHDGAIASLGVHEAASVLAALPDWLLAPTDAEAVAAALGQGVPELSGGTLKLIECEPKLRLKADRPGWTAAYELTLTNGDGQPQEVRLVGTWLPPILRTENPPADGESRGRSCGPFGRPSWEGTFPDIGLALATQPEDTGLPMLGALVEAGPARDLLEGALRAGSHPRARVRSVEVDVRRYKPGSRCTVLYHLDLEPGSPGPRSVVAKTYRGDKGANAYEGMAALWRSPMSVEGDVDLAEPLLYLQENKVLVQSCVAEEKTLKELAREAMGDGSDAALAGLVTAAEKAARGLAGLHNSGVNHGEVVTWEDEQAELMELADRMEAALPEASAATRSIVEALAWRNAESGSQAPVPSHRSFRPAQVLLAGERIAFIDFDGLCMAEPALDVGLFRSSLRDAGTRGLAETGRSGVGGLEASLDALDQVADAFEAEYRRCCPLGAAPVFAERVALWEGLHVLTSALHCWTKIKADRLAVRSAMLRRHLERLAL